MLANALNSLFSHFATFLWLSRIDVINQNLNVSESEWAAEGVFGLIEKAFNLILFLFAMRFFSPPLPERA